MTGLGATLVMVAACAGGDTPPRDQPLLDELLKRHPEDAIGAAGSVSMAAGGSGGSSAGAGGSGQGGGASGGAGGGASGAGGGSDGGSSGSGSSGAAGAGAVMACTWDQTVLYIACGIGSGCHGADSRFGDFGDSEAAARALVGVAAKVNSGCGDYIDSADPEKSLILEKIEGRQGPTCGVPMPFQNDALAPEEIACIRGWIDSL